MSGSGLEASCLCGAVRWRVGGALAPLAHCHCSVCRKAHGTPFATYMPADPDALEWLAGEASVARFESSPGFVRRFCRCCGSVVPGVAPDGHVFAPAGGALGNPGVRAKIHLFVASKAPWYEITDGLRQFDAFPRAEGPPGIGCGTHGLEDAQLAGSCLCGTVGFDVVQPITAVHNCHCTRCRRARAAAYATNGFTSADGVRFVRGEDVLVSYKLPEARSFTQVFCRRCGSIMPRIAEARGVAVIPFGALDGDPGVRAEDHIFVRDMAPWDEITDGLPRWEQAPGGSS